MYDSSANTCKRRSFQRVMIMRSIFNLFIIIFATPLIANDIGMMLKLLLMLMMLILCSCDRWCVERSLMVHFWRMMMHAETQAQSVMSIMMRLWRYVIMTVWICVVGVCLLSLRVFFIPENRFWWKDLVSERFENFGGKRNF